MRLFDLQLDLKHIILYSIHINKQRKVFASVSNFPTLLFVNSVVTQKFDDNVELVMHYFHASNPGNTAGIFFYDRSVLCGDNSNLSFDF